MRELIASALCLLAVQTGWSQDLSWRAVHHLIQARYGSVPTISTETLSEQLNGSVDQAPLLLDARSPEEFAVSHLPGARRVDPGAETYPALDSLNRTRPIVVYCSVGYRSAGVTKTLRSQGFSNVFNLEGSIFRWANEGRLVVRNGTRVSEVHPYDSAWGQLLADSLHAYQPGDDDR